MERYMVDLRWIYGGSTVDPRWVHGAYMEIIWNLIGVRGISSGS